MRSKLFLLVGIIGLFACNIPIPPVPTPTPPVPPEDPCQNIKCETNQHCVNGACVCNDCLPEVPWCGDVGQQCSTVLKPCKHNPSSDPCHCELAPKCPPVDPCEGVTCNPGYHCEKGNCVVDIPTPENPCPKKLNSSAIVYMNNKPYGNGFDSTVRVKGDPEFCRLIHGETINDCHLEGWPKRVECEYFLLGGNCPAWEYTVDTKVIYPCSDDTSAIASCDHFGNPINRDDPKTPTTGDNLENLKGFEGEPKLCGLHRNQFGPNQGFFTIAHGKAQIRACNPSDSNKANCGPWKAFDH